MKIGNILKDLTGLCDVRQVFVFNSCLVKNMNIQFHYFGNCQLDLYNLKNYLKKIYATVKASLLSLEKEDIKAEKQVFTLFCIYL